MGYRILDDEGKLLYETNIELVAGRTSEERRQSAYQQALAALARHIERGLERWHVYYDSSDL